LQANVADFEKDVPDELWVALQAQGLIQPVEV
jgi:hypothetical protein